MTLTQLMVSYQDAERQLANDDTYAMPIPDSLRVVAELRKRGVAPRVTEVKIACALVGLKLADL